MLRRHCRHSCHSFVYHIFKVLLDCIECMKLQTTANIVQIHKCSCFCLSRGFTRLWCARTAKLIEVLFGIKPLGGPRNIVLDGDPDLPSARERGAYSMQPSQNYVDGPVTRLKLSMGPIRGPYSLSTLHVRALMLPKEETKYSYNAFQMTSQKSI